ncbi:hypothetical protein A2U01_0109830, partial [Trifolium medium]|nr:hypothetical protein [Trifolium medium]
DLKMFRPLMENRIGCNVNSTLAITVKHWWSCACDAEILKQEK